MGLLKNRLDIIKKPDCLSLYKLKPLRYKKNFIRLLYRIRVIKKDFFEFNLRTVFCKKCLKETKVFEGRTICRCKRRVP